MQTAVVESPRQHAAHPSGPYWPDLPLALLYLFLALAFFLLRYE
jgi:hypothetical protein